MEIGALFDWDGVVIDSSRQHEKSWEMLAEESGLPLPKDHFTRGFGMKNQVIIPDILKWTDAPDQVERLSLRKEFLYREIIRKQGIEALPGVVRLLKLLQEQGVPCSIASSTPRVNIETVLDLIGLRACFKEVVSAEDVTRGKPDPEVFVLAAKRIGRDASSCIVFEDAHVGIEAGLAAGARVVAVATTNPLDALGKAHLAVPTLEALDWADLARLFG